MNTEHFKEELEAELAQVTKELKSLGKLVNPASGDWEATAGDIDTLPPQADPNEAGDKIEELEIRNEETEALEDRWRDIKDALTKIKEHKYGLCEVSGEPIEEDRLEANPAARTCKAHM